MRRYPCCFIGTTDGYRVVTLVRTDCGLDRQICSGQPTNALVREVLLETTLVPGTLYNSRIHHANRYDFWRLLLL